MLVKSCALVNTSCCGLVGLDVEVLGEVGPLIEPPFRPPASEPWDVVATLPDESEVRSAPDIRFTIFTAEIAAFISSIIFEENSLVPHHTTEEFNI